jgi:hypothetical protein
VSTVRDTVSIRFIQPVDGQRRRRVSATKAQRRRHPVTGYRVDPLVMHAIRTRLVLRPGEKVVFVGPTVARTVYR